MTNNPRRILIVTVYLAAALVYFAADSGRVPEAGATGGAFTSTKHGGGTVDSIKFDGVDRSIGTLGAFYYDDPEAGKYAPGECAHCHEMHASFSGTEPLPNSGGDSGPDKYLLMKEYGASANYAELCLYCHSNMMGGGGSGTGFWDFFKGSAVYQDSSHYNSGSFKWPGDTNLANVAGNIFPRRDRSGAPSGNTGSCLNCHTPHGIMGNFDGGTAPASGNYTVTSAANTGVMVERQTIAREEALCLNCHDGSPASTNVKTQVDNYMSNTGSGHPVRNQTFFGRHSLSGLDDSAATTSNNEVGWQVQTGWLTAASRHAECTDCHNPHVAQGKGTSMPAPWEGTVMQWSKGGNNAAGDLNPNRYDSPTDSTSSAVKLGAVNIGVWGVGVSNPSAGTIGAPIRSLSTSDRVYNLCLKCHSYWAWNAANSGPTAGDAPWIAPSSATAKAWDVATERDNLSMTNQAWEFASNRVAYHPVLAQGKNRPELSSVRNPCWCASALGGTAGFQCNTFTPITLIAEATYLGAGCFPSSGTRADLTGNIAQTLSQNFVPPWLHTSYITCVDCHEDNGETTPRGPHGSTMPFILRALDTTISYSRNGSGVFNYSAIADANNFCLNCHRADVYGWDSNVPVSAQRNGQFARQPHWSYDGGNSHKAATVDSQAPPNGIICMRCHGGNRDALGSIHGNDSTTCQSGCDTFDNDPIPCVPGTCNTSARLIPVTGVDAGSSEWTNWSKSSVANAGGCDKTTSVYCGNGSDGDFDVGASYNY